MSKDELRVGNFIYLNHPDHIRVQDISSTVVLTLSKRAIVARLVERAMEEGNEAFLRNYAAMAYYVNGTVPDIEFWKQMNTCIMECLNRHPELYGAIKSTDTSDAEIIQEEKKFQEVIDDLL